LKNLFLFKADYFNHSGQIIILFEDRNLDPGSGFNCITNPPDWLCSKMIFRVKSNEVLI